MLQEQWVGFLDGGFWLDGLAGECSGRLFDTLTVCLFPLLDFPGLFLCRDKLQDCVHENEAMIRESWDCADILVKSWLVCTDEVHNVVSSSGFVLQVDLVMVVHSRFREMVARETFNQSRRSIPIAAEDSVTIAMRSDKLRHTWLCWYYSSWIVMVKRRWDMYKTDLGYLTNDSMVCFISFPGHNTQ